MLILTTWNSRPLQWMALLTVAVAVGQVVGWRHQPKW